MAHGFPFEVVTDARLLVFVVLISSGTAILFGLAPAWHSARAEHRDIASCKARGGRSVTAAGLNAGRRAGGLVAGAPDGCRIVSAEPLRICATSIWALHPSACSLSMSIHKRQGIAAIERSH